MSLQISGKVNWIKRILWLIFLFHILLGFFTGLWMIDEWFQGSPPFESAISLGYNVSALVLSALGLGWSYWNESRNNGHRQTSDEVIDTNNRKIALIDEIIECAIQFRDQFAHTRSPEAFEKLSEVRNNFMKLRRKSEGVLGDNLSDISDKLDGSYGELGFAINFEQKSRPAPPEKEERWASVLYGERNRELYQAVKQATEDLKQKFDTE